MSDEREAKLPKWVRDELARLRRELEYTEGVLEKELKGKQATEPHVAAQLGYANKEHVKRYDHHTHITFQMGNRDSSREKIEAYVRDNVLLIYGGTAINVRPTSSNAIQIRLEDF